MQLEPYIRGVVGAIELGIGLLVEGFSFALFIGIVFAFLAWAFSLAVPLPLEPFKFGLIGMSLVYGVVIYSLVTGHRYRRKVFTTTFTDFNEIEKYTNKSGWHYIGYKGVTKKYHEYRGWHPYFSPRYSGASSTYMWEQYQLKIYNNGVAHLYSTCESRVVGLSSLPERVYPAKSFGVNE